MCSQFNLEVHRLVDLSIFSINRDFLPNQNIRQALGYFRFQADEAWKQKVLRGFQPDLKVEIQHLHHSRVIPCNVPNERWGLSVFTSHPASWHKERDFETIQDLYYFLNSLPSPVYQVSANSLVHQLQNLSGVTRHICFKTVPLSAAPNATPTRLPKDMIMDFDQTHIAANNPLHFDGLKSYHCVLIPKASIEVDNCSPGLPNGGGIGFLYDNNRDGHWDEWVPCCVVQIQVRAEERDEVGRDREASLLLNSIEFAAEIYASDEQLLILRQKLLDSYLKTQPNFKMEIFMSSLVPSEVPRLLGCVTEYSNENEQDPETLESLLKFFPPGN